MRSWKIANAFLRGVGPAAVGSIAAVSAKLGRDAIVDAWTAAIFAVALALAWRYGPIPSMAIASAAGIIVGQLT